MGVLLTRGLFRWIIEYEGRIWRAGRTPNGIVTATIDHVWDVAFSNGTPETAWFGGLIGTITSLSPTDSMASHSGWTEATNYSEATRPAWGPGNSAGGVKTNDVAMQFTISTEQELQGMFLASDNTKGGASGLLWATGQFSTGKTTPPVGAIFKLFYELEGREG